MQQTEDNLKEEYLKLFIAHSVDSKSEVKKDNIRKDIDLLLDVLGHHTVTKSISDSTICEYVIFDNNDRSVIIEKLLSKIKQL